MNLYSRDDERAIRAQRMVEDWTKSGLLQQSQRDQIMPTLQVDLRRTNRFLRGTLFVFGLEVFAAALFLSIFAGRLQRRSNLERLNVVDLAEVDPAAPEELGATPAGR
jgi:hypothetical protein